MCPKPDTVSVFADWKLSVAGLIEQPLEPSLAELCAISESPSHPREREG